MAVSGLPPVVTMKSIIRFILLVLGVGGISYYALNAGSQEPMSTSNEAPEQPSAKVVKTDAEWKEQLTSEQYYIARQGGTERPNGNIYKQFKDQGSGRYYCVGCNAELFSSETKFDSRSGWPSFYDPTKAKNVKSLTDKDGHRTEVKCKVCDAHLGHVFSGEGFQTPTNKRYCVNGAVLTFVPEKSASQAEK